jgi:segregation and condensation protein B
MQEPPETAEGAAFAPDASPAPTSHQPDLAEAGPTAGEAAQAAARDTEHAPERGDAAPEGSVTGMATTVPVDAAPESAGEAALAGAADTIPASTDPGLESTASSASQAAGVAPRAAADGNPVTPAEPDPEAPPSAARAATAPQQPSPAGEPGLGAEAIPDPGLFAHALRLAEALVFASDRPITPQRLQQALPPGVEARAVLTALAAQCADRPVQLVEAAGGFAFRTAPELAPALTRVVEVPRRLPRAAMETLAIIAYHQPVTRAEVEEIRGASLSQTTLETLLEMGLIAPRGRKEVPGRPSLWGTTPKFLEQFGLRALTDLPRREELVNEPGSPLLVPAAPAEAPPPA